MENKIKDEIKLNESKAKRLDKELKETLTQLQSYLNKNVAENNIYEIINHLPGYVTELEHDYIKLASLKAETKIFEYLLKSK